MYIYWKKSNRRKKNSNEAGMLKILTNFLLFGLIFYFGHLMKNDLKKKDLGNADEFLQNCVYVGLECLKSIWCNAETDV